MSERSTPFLLEDMLDSVNNILRFTNGLSFDAYTSDLKTMHAVQHNFMIIGEAVARIPEDFKVQHPELNWRQIKDFRNVIVHDYFGVDNSIVWEIINSHLPELKLSLTELIAGS